MTTAEQPPSDTPTAVDRLMKRCQVGVGGRNALNDAHDIMAECYGTLGRLQGELAAAQARIEKLVEHALKVLPPFEKVKPTEAEEWIDNKMARHGEGHHAVANIYPSDLGMLQRALRQLSCDLSTAQATIARQAEELERAKRACRRAVVALAHAAIHHDEYNEDYKFVSDAIEALAAADKEPAK